MSGKEMGLTSFAGRHTFIQGSQCRCSDSNQIPPNTTLEHCSSITIRSCGMFTPEKVEMEVISEYFGFPSQFSFLSSFFYGSTTL
jgi:hypothetical protein